MRTFIIYSILLFTLSNALSQEKSTKDSISSTFPQITIYSGAVISTGEQAPFWFVANNSQRISKEPQSIWSRVLIEKDFDQQKKFDFGYGLDMIGRFDGGWSGDLTQAYAKMKYGHFQLFAGRQEEVFGMIDSTLSIGTLVNGNNALPIPKIAFSTLGWLDVPFTKGYVQFNAYFSHGWFEKDRFVQNAFLHQKYFYLKVGGKNIPFEAYGGIVFNTQWGGTRSDNNQKQPSGFDDYIRIVLGQEGGNNASQSDQNNALGNHLGTWEIGGVFDLGKWKLTNYWQFLWEDRSGLTPFNWRDGMVGLSLKRKTRNHWINGANLEIIRTNDQDATKIGDNGQPFLEPDNFFNNGQYISGWTYKDVVIGNPVFLLLDKNDFSLNRIKGMINGVNLGIEGVIFDKKLSYQVNYFHFKNQGTKFQELSPRVRLNSVLLKGGYQLKNSQIQASLNYEWGNLFEENTIGIKLTWIKKL